ncbi:MAG: 16S rRNA (uracil(1498)-N(3))-methyltransferase [Anaerolineae bacterium]|nr:16S rRNA (uracil(1498)-N(3))-methyltransferase [Anaerolineae bacterium]
MTHRFFIPSASLTPPTVRLPDEVAHQIRTVLRMRSGDEIIVLDGSGRAWQVRLTRIDRGVVEGEIMAEQPVSGEPALHLTLYQGTLKAQKFEWVLQKGTELGLSRFVPTICQRSVANEAAALAKKQARWQRIIREAAEQSRRGKLPELADPIPFEAAIRHSQSADLRLMAWEEAPETASLKAVLAGQSGRSLALFIGPEGGFSQVEADLAQRAEVQLVSLGPRILRAETAGLALSAAVMFVWGEWN